MPTESTNTSALALVSRQTPSPFSSALSNKNAEENTLLQIPHVVY
jgi:hypothetical protein